MIELRWMCWHNAGTQRLEYRQTVDLPSGIQWTEWKTVPEFDATHPAVTPAKE